MTIKTSVSATFVFAGDAIETVVPRVVDAGFQALEFQTIDRATAPMTAQLIAAAGLDVALVNMSVGDLAEGGPGLSAVPDRASAFNAALAEMRDIASVLRPKIVHIGPSRIPAGVDHALCLARLADNLRLTARALSPLGARISVEVLNNVEFPGLVVDSIECAEALIDQIDDPAVVLQYDIYHAAMDGRDILADLARLYRMIGHVQFADCPGRQEPGTGTLDFKAYFTLLNRLDYDGYVGAEYRPSPTDDFSWLKQLLPT